MTAGPQGTIYSKNNREMTGVDWLSDDVWTDKNIQQRVNRPWCLVQRWPLYTMESLALTTHSVTSQTHTHSNKTNIICSYRVMARFTASGAFHILPQHTHTDRQTDRQTDTGWLSAPVITMHSQTCSHIIVDQRPAMHNNHWHDPHTHRLTYSGPGAEHWWIQYWRQWCGVCTVFILTQVPVTPTLSLTMYRP